MHITRSTLDGTLEMDTGTAQRRWRRRWCEATHNASVVVVEVGEHAVGLGGDGAVLARALLG